MASGSQEALSDVSRSDSGWFGISLKGTATGYDLWIRDDHLDQSEEFAWFDN